MRPDRLAAAVALIVLCPSAIFASPPNLAAGTPVALVLLKKLSSGGAKVGSEIPLMVSEDVKDDQGKVVIKQGTWAIGVVTASKGLGLLSLPGSHARLDLRPVKTWTVGGTEVALQASQKDGKGPHIFTRDNTGAPRPIPALEKLWANKSTQQMLSEASEALGASEAPAWTHDPEKVKQFALAAKDMDLAKASELAGANQIGQVYSLVRAAQDCSIAKMATSSNDASALAMQATLEMARLADSVQSRAAGAFKKRNIVAHVGTPLTAYVSKPVTAGSE
jgi:hypothetical protein